MNTDSELLAPQRRVPDHPMRTLLLGSAVALSIFLLDIALLRGELGGIPYVVLMLLSLWLPWRYAPLTMAIIGSALTVGSYRFAAVGAGHDVPMVHLGIDLAALWVTAYLLFRHLTSRKSLEDTEGQLRALVNTAVDGVIIIDSSGVVRIFNPACEKLFGYSAREVIGRNVSMLMPTPYKDEHDAYLARYRETGERRIIGIGREVEGRRRDGTTFPLELSVGETRNGQGQRFIGIIRDITARKAGEKALQMAKEQAESASHAKSLFLANMSHEIRTPMNAVLGYTQIMERDPAFPERHRRALEAIDRAGSHLLGVINQILDLSKIEAGAMELDIVDFGLDELLAFISALFEIRCAQKDLDWRVETRIDRETVRGDQGKLRQVLINLLGNAVKFTSRGSVGLLVGQSGDLHRFEVTDTGSGIAPAEREHIFEPFQQSEEGLAKGGTGLGLTLSKRQIELMGGKLEVSSQVGEGSRFAFEIALPAAAGPIASPSLASERILRLAPECRVDALVVDDVADNRELLTRMLETVGTNVAVAEDGVDALEQIRLHRPDIIFMDVRMPVMDGVEALRHIREESGATRIVCVALSAAGWSHETRDYLEAGFDDFIVKPYRFETLCECMEKRLNVRFHREATAPAVAHRFGTVPDLSAVRLPETLRQRLLRAARINAFTEIEAILDELKEMGSREQELAQYLIGLLQRYDSRAIADTMAQIAPHTGEQA